MPMPHQYSIGDWVRFYKGGIFVIGVVEYIRNEFGYWYYQTDVGEIKEEYILEVRKRV